MPRSSPPETTRAFYFSFGLPFSCRRDSSGLYLPPLAVYVHLMSITRNKAALGVPSQETGKRVRVPLQFFQPFHARLPSLSLKRCMDTRKASEIRSSHAA